jgi:hypothetical protein
MRKHTTKHAVLCRLVRKMKMWSLSGVVILSIISTVLSVGNEELSIIRGKRGQQAVYRGHCFTHLRVKQDKKITVWECVVRSCRSLLTTTLDSKAVVRCNPHNHPDNEALCSAKKLRAALKDSIIHNPNQQTTTLCRTELLQVDSAVAEHLVTKENIARNLMYHRSKQRPALPRTTADLHIPEYLGKTTSGERFILKCAVTEDDTIVIYASDFSVTHLYVTRKQLVATVRLNACQICSLNCSP